MKLWVSLILALVSISSPFAQHPLLMWTSYTPSDHYVHGLPCKRKAFLPCRTLFSLPVLPLPKTFISPYRSKSTFTCFAKGSCPGCFNFSIFLYTSICLSSALTSLVKYSDILRHHQRELMWIQNQVYQFCLFFLLPFCLLRIDLR